VQARTPLVRDFDGPANTPLEVLVVLEHSPFRTSSQYVDEACSLAETHGWAAKDGDTWHLTLKGYEMLKWMRAYHCGCGWSTPRHLGSAQAIVGTIRAWLHKQRCAYAGDIFV
jgi:hypothetical protein